MRTYLDCFLILALLGAWACTSQKPEARAGRAPWDLPGGVGTSEDGRHWRFVDVGGLTYRKQQIFQWDTDADTVIGRGHSYWCGVLRSTGEFTIEVADCSRILVLPDSIKVIFARAE